MSASPTLPHSKELPALVESIEQLLEQMGSPEPSLLRANRLQAVKDSLLLDGSFLTEEQLSACFEKKKAVGSAKAIQEAENMFRAYGECGRWNTASEADFKKAHAVLMKGLIAKSGQYRASAVGTLKGAHVSRVAPPPTEVPLLMENLFAFLKHNKKQSPLLLSAIAHYEIEAIQPFDDGNGRIGRLWQHAILSAHHPALTALPFETMLREKQPELSIVLERCNLKGDSTLFVEFALEQVLFSLQELQLLMPKKKAAKKKPRKR